MLLMLVIETLTFSTGNSSCLIQHSEVTSAGISQDGFGGSLPACYWFNNSGFVGLLSTCDFEKVL